MSSAAADVDPFVVEIIRDAVVAVTDEMKTTLMRTAYSHIIYEIEDFTVGLYDAQGSTISFGLGLPMWMSGLSSAIKMKIRHWGEDIHPGDVMVTNAAEVHGSHINHMIFTVPVFNEGELVAFASSMAHWPDVGGVLTGTTTDIFSEGFQLPFVKAYKRGVRDEEIFDIIRINTRFPDVSMGDCRAQLATIWTGERRLSEILGKYGNATFRAAIAQINDHSEKIARAAVRAVPDGVYEAEEFVDNDGLDISRNLPVKVRVIVAGDEMTVDLSQIGPQVNGFVNCGETAGRSGAEVAFKTLTTPTLRPINDGAMRPLKVITAPHTMITADKTSAMKMWMVVPDTIVDTIWKALTPVMPRQGAAGHHGAICMANVRASIDPVTGRAVPRRNNSAVGMTGGGWGAVYNADGQCATIGVNDGDTHAPPVESGEAKAPEVVLEHSLRQDSGGAGQFRGGLGAMLRFESREEAIVDANLERTQCHPYGVFGGHEAATNEFAIERVDGSIQRFRIGMVPPTRISSGDIVVLALGGGGGYGDPLRREAGRVFEDVRNEYISIESARDEYGVVVHQRGPRDYELDEPATAGLRARLDAAAMDERARLDAAAMNKKETL
jgi:N-methylhydantoinase B